MLPDRLSGAKIQKAEKNPSVDLHGLGMYENKKALISCMSIALHLGRPAQCVWVQGYYSLLFQQMCVQLVCTPNWKCREKFIAGVIHINYHRWWVYTCWVHIPHDDFISTGFKIFQRWISFRTLKAQDLNLLFWPCT